MEGVDGKLFLSEHAYSPGHYGLRAFLKSFYEDIITGVSGAAKRMLW